MKKFLSIIIFLFLVLSLFNPIRAYAISKQASVGVSGSVGEFYLNISGFISPFASVVMTSDGVFIRATVADENGNFSISQVLIKQDFSHFCLDAVDFKRIGESFTCFSFPPANSNITMTDIFLPPTLGLSRSEIAEWADTVAFGYTMPGALVTLNINNKKLNTTADANGYYQFNLSKLKAGNYSLYTTATYHNKHSLSSEKKLKLKSLTWWEVILLFIGNLWKNFLRFLTSLSLGPLWLVIPIIILIIILIFKLWPGAVPFKKEKHLHHYYFMGY